MDQFPYTIGRDENDRMTFKRHPDAGEGTKIILLSKNLRGSGSVMRRDEHTMPAEHWGWLEYYDGDDGEYYRIPFGQVRDMADGDITEIVRPAPLPVRSSHWPGMSPREVEQDERVKQLRRVRQQLRVMAELKAYRERQAELKAQEEAHRATVRATMRSDEDVLAEMAQEMFGDDWRQYDAE